MTTQRQKIAGKYTLWGVVPNCSYEFAGNNRAASFGITGDRVQMRMKALNALSIDSNVTPVMGANLQIKRAKIEPSGASELRPPAGELAAGFFLNLVYTDADENLQVLDSIALQFDRWGKWCDINKDLKAYGNIKPPPTACAFSIQPSFAFFKCDDYNIEDAYIGQTVTPVLVLEVETPGMWDSVSRIKF